MLTSFKQFQNMPCWWFVLLVFSFFLAGTSALAMAQEGEPDDSGTQLSDRILNYRIEVGLDPLEKTVQGHETLTWRNTSGQALQDFCFHLYLNAFRNNRSTFVQESSARPLWGGIEEIPENYWGYTDIESIQVVADQEAFRPRVVKREFIHPDDDNEMDRSVFRIELDQALPAEEVIEFRIAFTSKLPKGTRRTGWAEDYFFVAQWFPKIGVVQDGQWNCHQYHQSSEYFADFGVYDVSFTVPADFIVGATGKRVDQQDNGDGTTTYRYVQEDVHDFAWTGSPRFLEKTRLFSSPPLPEVEMTLLLLPEHRHLEERYFVATEHALHYYGTWFGPYPYETITVVDPAYRSNSGGMEYPTFLTGGANFWAPEKVLSPEGVTIHEVGHQWWYGMSANNEFEESWLDEGLNSWSESRVQKYSYEPSRFMRRLFGGIPFTFDSVEIPFETGALASVRRDGQLDVMTRRAWEYLGRPSYRVNSYSKPEMILWTLERWLGEDVMLKAMSTYFQRYQFKHPTTHDFIETINEVAGQDMGWFFDQTFFTSELVDYGIETARSVKIPEPEGVFDDGRVVTPSTEESDKGEEQYLTEVVVKRFEGARFPVEVLMVFEDGEEIREEWDGQDRWHRYRAERPTRLKYAQVDPERKLLLDIDPTNNGHYARQEEGYSLATRKWAAKWLFWLQNLLEVFAFVG